VDYKVVLKHNRTNRNQVKREMTAQYLFLLQITFCSYSILLNGAKQKLNQPLFTAHTLLIN